MSDIEKLIERLWEINCGSQRCQTIRDEAADAMTRLVAPLPAEVAEAIRCCTEETRAITFAECARLLESLARENARLVNNHHVQNRANAVLAKERDRLAAMLTKSSEDNDAWIEMLEERDRLAAENAELRATLNAERENRSDNGDPMLIDRLRAELASYKAATKLVVEYDRQQDKLDAKKGG